MNSEGNTMISGKSLSKVYMLPDSKIVAIDNVDIEIHKGEIVSIVGNSGSGKSTLLNLIGGLEKATTGSLSVNYQDMQTLTNKELVLFKRKSVGFVWQNNARNLIPYLSAIENIEIPMLLNGFLDKTWALQLLEEVGLSYRKNNKLDQLSGGEQQRVAIAIALANKPQILLADEPTGAVDSKTAMLVMDIIKDIRNQYNTTVVIVTHDLNISKQTDYQLFMENGRLINC